MNSSTKRLTESKIYDRYLKVSNFNYVYILTCIFSLLAIKIGHVLIFLSKRMNEFE